MDENLMGKKILVVEDDSSLSSAMADKLKRAGFFVWVAKNGEEGLSTALQQHPDMIFLDVVMPKVDGLGMLQNLREDEWGKTVPIVFLSNLSYPEKQAGLIDDSEHLYFLKSDLKLEDIVKVAKEVCELAEYGQKVHWSLSDVMKRVREKLGFGMGWNS